MPHITDQQMHASAAPAGLLQTCARVAEGLRGRVVAHYHTGAMHV